MKRDSVLFLVAGVLVGFIAGYWLHEEMASRQPPRRLPGQVEAGPVGPADPGAGAGAGAMGGMSQADVQELTARVQQNPEDADAVLRLAELNHQIANWPRAAQLYERYLALRPDDPGVMSDLGIAYRQMGRMDDALARFDQAQAVAPEHWQSRFNEVIVRAFDLRQFDQARQALDELRRLQPGNPEVERLATEIDRLERQGPA